MKYSTVSEEAVVEVLEEIASDNKPSTSARRTEPTNLISERVLTTGTF